jgi:hypothetical protein
MIGLLFSVKLEDYVVVPIYIGHVTVVIQQPLKPGDVAIAYAPIVVTIRHGPKLSSKLCGNLG